MELLARDSLRIVHVENYDAFAQIDESSLNEAGFEQPIVRCNDGVLALHYFSMIEPQFAPHVILLDLHLPDMSGIDRSTMARWGCDCSASCTQVLPSRARNTVKPSGNA